MKSIEPVAYVVSDFKEKFGIPRQSGRAPSVISKIVFYPKYNNPDAIRGLENFSHIWVIFDFSKNNKKNWSATVRPPRLGGNTHMGVFATRSPYRPNNLGLSSVKLEGIEFNKNLGNVLIVSGADMLDGTPVYDIKPYISFTDCHIDAQSSYADEYKNYSLTVKFDNDCQKILPKDKLQSLIECLQDDPRPSYQNDSRTYGMKFSQYEIKFNVNDNILTVTNIIKVD